MAGCTTVFHRLGLFDPANASHATLLVNILLVNGLILFGMFFAFTSGSRAERVEDLQVAAAAGLVAP